MNHEEATQLLQEYHDHELDEATARAVELHCRSCAPCSRVLETWKQLQLVIQDAAVADLGPAFVDELRESVLTDRDSSGVWLTVEPLARRTVVALAVVVALLTSMFWSSGDERTVTGPHAVVIVPTDSVANMDLLQTNELTKADVLFAMLGE